jgi:histidine triad (HIT) family protein
MNNCVFCKIAQKEISAYFVSESNNFLAFLDIHPHAPGHTLVIPKEHFDNLEKLPLELSQEFIKIIQETKKLLTNTLKTTDFTLGINEGPLAGQAVLHLHFHLIPRFKNDGGGSIHSVVFNQPQEFLEEIYQKIKNASQN